MITCPRCNGQCAPSDDICTDWKSRALAAETERDALKAEVERLKANNDFLQNLCKKWNIP